MPDVDRTSRRRVLHLVEVADPFSEKLEALLAPGGAERVVVPDVYGALAQLVRPAHVRFDAVVVCLAGLDPSEMEFFSLVPRGPGAAPVFVYSADGDAAKVAQAQAAGATAVGEPAPILSAIEAAEPRAPTEPEPAETAPPAPAAAAEMPAPSAVSESVELEAPAPVEEVPAVPAPVAPPLARVPVPWAPAANRPKRRAPATFGQPREPVAPGSADARPLLTDEELDALLGPARTESTPLDAEPQS